MEAKAQAAATAMTRIRQMDLIPEGILQTPITIVGAGAIGSFTALSLAKMGFSSLTVFDADAIGIENMNCQFYPLGAIGSKKVETLAKLVELFAGQTLNARAEAYQGPREGVDNLGPFPGIVISAVDNMAARRLLWDNHKGGKSIHTQWFIDPRMGGEYALLYTMNPNDPADIKTYEKTLYADSDATPERCTARATIYTALLLSGMVCKAVKDVLTQEPGYPRIMDWNIRANAQTVYKVHKA